MPMTNHRWTSFVLPLLACAISSTCATTISAADDTQSIADVRLKCVAEPVTSTYVRIRGVVTLRAASSIVIQDDSAGITVDFGTARVRGMWNGDGIPKSVQVGVEVEIDGTIDPGGVASPVLPRAVRGL
ncbi:MAG: hypothetical protein WCJ18_04010, partial [Planctomycetota bacterium]